MTFFEDDLHNRDCDLSVVFLSLLGYNSPGRTYIDKKLFVVFPISRKKYSGELRILQTDTYKGLYEIRMNRKKNKINGSKNKELRI